MLEQGLLFENLAEQLFPNLTRLGFSTQAEYANLPAKTEQAINSEVGVIAQGRVEVDDLTCIFDVLERNSNGSFNLYEIKATTSDKPEHQLDLAYQLYVLEKFGCEIDRVGVIHVNNSYRRAGEINIQELAVVTDITDLVRKKLSRVAPGVAAAIEILRGTEKPDLSPLHADSSAFSDWLKIFKSLQAKPLPENHIYHIAGLGLQRAIKLAAAGVEYIEDIPDSVSLTKKQKLQIEARLAKKPIVDVGAIRSFLESLSYPIYFLDYETFSSVIPPLDNLNPYQQVPFQYSLHRLDEDGTLTHSEFLHREASDPVPELTKVLKADIGKEGSVLVWYESFEKGRNEEMAEANPGASDFFLGLNDRIVDLMKPFSKNMYVDARFEGSASIKKVLPVLAPELRYTDLEIQNGSVAQKAWMENVFEAAEPDEKVFADLIEYCTLDTYAMVAIYRVLSDLI